MQRIAIVGPGGSGKSTLAQQLGAILHLPVIHLDSYFWQPGWVQTPTDEWRQKVEQFAQQEAWIIDGNYASTVDIRLVRADTVIMLDFSRFLCIYRVLKRRVQFAGKTRPDMNEGCPERIDWDFIKWIWDYPRRSRGRVLEKIELHRDRLRVIMLRSPAEVKQFLRQVGL